MAVLWSEYMFRANLGLKRCYQMMVENSAAIR